MGDLLTGKKILVMGAANKRSIAWGCAQMMMEQGAQLIFTYQNERLKKSLHKLVADENALIECDVASDESLQTAFATIKDQFGKVDGIVHAIAFAPKDALGGDIMNASRSTVIAVPSLARRAASPASNPPASNSASVAGR